MGSKLRVRPNDDPWKLFTGDDLCYPVEMFVHIMEFKSGQEGSDDCKMAEDILNHIPDPKLDGQDQTPTASLNVPAAIWKHKILAKHSQQTPLSWTSIKPDLMEEFGSKPDYSLREKLNLLQSVGKGPYEDSLAYLIRIKCVVSLLINNKIPASITDLPSGLDVWVKVLFLFGLDEMEQNLVIEESDLKTLEELCKVLALPEVKMIRRADDAMKKQEQDEEVLPKRKRKRKKAVDYDAMLEEFSDDDQAVKREGYGDDPLQAVIKEERLDFVDEEDIHEDDFDDDFKPVVPQVEMEEEDDYKRKGKSRLNPAKKSWPCAFCDTEPFKTRADLWVHQDDLHEGYREKCVPCDLKFYKIADLTSHNYRFHPQETKKAKKYKKYVYDQISAQVAEAQKEET